MKHVRKMKLSYLDILGFSVLGLFFCDILPVNAQDFRLGVSVNMPNIYNYQ